MAARAERTPASLQATAAIAILVGARSGGAEQKGWRTGSRVVSPAEAARQAQLVCLLTPDMSHRDVYTRDIEPNLKSGDTLLVAHGFSVLYGEVEPRSDLDVVLVAPKGPGDLVRREYEIGRGVPCLFAVHQDASGSARDKALAYTRGIGGTRAGAIETSETEETETDLFGEQAGAVRRRDRAGCSLRFQDARRRRVQARGRLFQDAAGGNADRRPHVRGRL